MSGLSIVLMAMALAAGAPEERVLPDGWRPPTEREMTRSRAINAAEMGRTTSDQQFSVKGDFDGDGHPDEAMMLFNDRQQKLAIFLERGAGGPLVRLSPTAPLDLVWNQGVTVTAPGTYPTACGKGIGDSAGCEPTVTLRWPGVSLVTYEAGIETFYWTQGGFRTVTLSD